MSWIECENQHHLDEGIFVKCIAEIRNNSTGEIREYETEELLEHGMELPYIFNWEENNYSCDCNRRIFFNRVKEEFKTEDFHHPCTDGLFSVNLKNVKDGEIYYKEF